MNWRQILWQPLRARQILALGGIVSLVLISVAVVVLFAMPEFRPVPVLPAQPPITQFPTKPVRQAAEALNLAELVVGVTVRQEARAYPINMLTGPQREILNDMLGGRAIAATW